ncbi:MAG: glycosyltransferase, partial [Phycisphaerae bacterium]
MGLNGGTDATALRVAWLIAGDEGEGVAQAVRGLAAAVRELGVWVAIVSISDGKFCRELRERGFEVRVLGGSPLPVLRGGPLRKVWLLAGLLVAISRVKRALARVLRELRVDAVHFLWPTFLPLAGPVAARLGVACIWEMANVPGRYPLAINRRLLRWFVRRHGVTVLANSEFTAETLASKRFRPVVLYPGGDERRFDPAAVKPVGRAELGIPPDAIVLGIFGRIVRPKGQLLVLQAMVQLKDLQPPLHLLLLGPERDAA